jgi:hypothetical protein
MKRFLCSILPLFVLLVGISDVPALAAISLPYVPGAGTGCTEDGDTMNLGATGIAGDVMMLVAQTDPGFEVTEIVNGTGASGLVWTHLDAQDCDSSSEGHIQYWYATLFETPDNGIAITVNSTAGNDWIAGCLFDIRGLAAPLVVGNSSCNDIVSPASPLLATAFTTTHAEELIFAASIADDILSHPCTTENLGVTFLGVDCGDGGDGFGGSPMGYYITSTAGTYQAALLANSATIAGVSQVSFVGASTGPPPNQMPLTE